MTYSEDECFAVSSLAVLQVLRYSDGEKYGPHFDSAEQPGVDNQVEKCYLASSCVRRQSLHSAALTGESLQLARLIELACSAGKDSKSCHSPYVSQ